MIFRVRAGARRHRAVFSFPYPASEFCFVPRRRPARLLSSPADTRDLHAGVRFFTRPFMISELAVIGFGHFGFGVVAIRLQRVLKAR